jgi:FAD/FMN-containing dehydrogenase/Fe-S oxidoreductase
MKTSVINRLKSLLGTNNVLTSQPVLEAYASDASIYRGNPRVVLIPKEERRLKEAVKVLLANGHSITPRGAGTGLAGGAVGDDVIIDFSRLNRVIRCDTLKQTVEVQSGIVYEKLNRYLAPLKLFFPPDPSSGDTCEIGGMLGNNSSGARSVKYGTTREYVEEINLILPDGRPFTARDYKLDSSEIKELFHNYPEFEKIYKLIDGNREEILASYPRVKKNVCGYDLKTMVEKLEQGIFALPQLFVGSEGSLGLFISARLRLLPLPKSKMTCLILFKHLADVGHATLDFLELKPAGLELIDGNTLDLIGRERFDLPPSAEAMLIVEFDDPPFDETVENLKSFLCKYELSGEPVFETDPKRQASLWDARKAIVPTLYRLDSEARPWGFIEDAAVPSENMPEFIMFLNDLFRRNNLTCGIFGHIGDGNLHVRPAINLSTLEGQKLARNIYDQTYEKIFELGGSATAEHGDGRLRAEVIEQQYGHRVYNLFGRIKEILDPEHLANPDVLVSKKSFIDHIDVEKVVRECAACGKCNAYCPSYAVNGCENMSARGWVRVMLAGDFNAAKSARELDGCLNCKNCAMVCPAGVDVSEYVTFRRGEARTFWGNRIFNRMRDPIKFENMVKLNGLFLRMMDNRLMRPLLSLASSPLVKLDTKRYLPRIAKKSLRERYSRLNETGGNEVAYFYGCADNLLHSRTGPALIALLEEYGYDLALPEQKCCGMPQQTYGYSEYEREHAIYNLESLDRFKHIVFSCATCLGEVLSYPRLFKKGDRHYDIARSVASKCYDISEFILRHVDLKIDQHGQMPVKISFHQPCHLREAGRVDSALELIRNLPLVNYVPMEHSDKCCGSAGTFNIFHYKDSMKIFEPKKKALKRADPDLVLTNCPTCILQYVDAMKSPGIACHSVELIADLCGLDV